MTSFFCILADSKYTTGLKDGTSEEMTSGEWISKSGRTADGGADENSKEKDRFRKNFSKFP